MMNIKKQLIKADQYILDTLTTYVKKWIAKKEFKKHKIDFMLYIENLSLVVLIVWGVTIPCIMDLIAGDEILAISRIVSWLFLICVDLYFIHKIKTDIKPWHDQAFSLRKNPVVYAIEKESLETIFISGRRNRILATLGFTCINIFLGTLLIVVSFYSESNSHFIGEFLIFNMFTSIISRYLIYVFDFDEPEPTKKASSSVSEIILKSWQKLIGGLSPVPNYG